MSDPYSRKQPIILLLHSILNSVTVFIELCTPSEIYYDRGNHYEFVKLDKDLARPGDMTESCSFPFEFLKVVKQYESYTGRNVRLR